MFDTSDITLYYSGDWYNSDPSLSIGSGRSNVKIPYLGKNTLFPDATSNTFRSNSKEYRGVYLVNTGDTTVGNFKFWIEALTPSSNVRFGFPIIDITNITITNTGTMGVGDYFTLKMGDDDTETEKIYWDGDISVMCQRISYAITVLRFNQSAALDNLGVLVGTIQTLGEQVGDDVVFQVGIKVSYGGNATLSLGDDNQITSPSEITFDDSVTDIYNDIFLPNLGYPSNTPVGIEFKSPGEDNSVDIGDFAPSEILGIWIERTNPTTVTNVTADDGFTLKITGQYLG